MAIGGAACKLFVPQRVERYSVILYLALGWTVLAIMGPLLASVSIEAVTLLLVGGILYSIGVVFHMWDALPYQRAIWHGFVLAAAVCHYAAVLGDVAVPGLLA